MGQKREPGWNADRHACRTCKFRTDEYAARRNSRGCDYIIIEGHSRGCKVEDCVVYEKGKRKRAI